MSAAWIVIGVVAFVILYALGVGVSERYVRRLPAHSWRCEYGYIRRCDPAERDYCFPHGSLVYAWPIAVPLAFAWWLVIKAVVPPIRAVYRLGAGREPTP